MDLAEKVVDDATAIDDADGRDNMDVVLAATARCFLSKTLDALAVLRRFCGTIHAGELELLVVGRPIAAPAKSRSPVCWGCPLTAQGEAAHPRNVSTVS